MFLGVDQHGCLFVTEIHLVAKKFDVDQLPDIFFAVVAVDCRFSCELLSDFLFFDLDSFDFGFFIGTISQV